MILRLVVESMIGWAAYLLLRGQARAVDRAAARAAAAHRAAAVTAARRAAEREYLATLHDTASATLLMVAEGAHSPAWLPQRAARDLERLGTVPASPASQVDLARLLTAVEHPVVAVKPEIHGPLVLPASPAFGILHGVCEAITNVARHAGVAEARLAAGRDEHDRIVVELRDHGRGFRPGRVNAQRRGITTSIVERMAAAGGRAVVDSKPGAGTVVRWLWPDV